MAENTNLFKKLVQVRQAVGKVDKDGNNSFQKFRFQSIEAINTAIRSALNDAGIWMFSECTGIDIVMGSETKEHYAKCKYRYTFVDGDTGQAQALEWEQGAPIANNNAVMNDKAVGIIHSYAQKYFLIRTFLITTQEDIELDMDGSASTQSAPQSNGTSSQDEDTRQSESGATEATDVVVTKIGENERPYLVIEGCTFFSREPLRELGFDVEGLDKQGVHNLPDKVQIVWELDNGFKKPLRLRRDSTGKIYQMPQAS